MVNFFVNKAVGVLTNVHGRVAIGFGTDNTLIPDGDALGPLFTEQFSHMHHEETRGPTAVGSCQRARGLLGGLALAQVLEPLEVGACPGGDPSPDQRLEQSCQASGKGE